MDCSVVPQEQIASYKGALALLALERSFFGVCIDDVLAKMPT
jgi:hypothetical protein